ncbi:ankyrin repeat domain-containing protein [Paenibacillus sp. FSL H8-0079]|uniref:ankyrin repeat domain-containing protein n=1 Tax=Paenibacillus sp. FSL H8-0079 TaxID=2921375 RepID=UPI0030EB8087
MRMGCPRGLQQRYGPQFRHISDELVRWLVEQGADINSPDKYQRTPLHAHASHWSGNVPLFLELGADLDAVDYQNETPLHAAYVEDFSDSAGCWCNSHPGNERVCEADR